MLTFKRLPVIGLHPEYLGLFDLYDQTNSQEVYRLRWGHGPSIKNLCPPPSPHLLDEEHRRGEVIVPLRYQTVPLHSYRAGYWPVYSYDV